MPTTDVNNDAWSRFSDGMDVFAFPHGTGGACIGCKLVQGGRGDFQSDDKVHNFVVHMRRHRDAGHKVPDDFEQRVRDGWPKAAQ